MPNIIKTNCACCILISVKLILIIDNGERILINDKVENMQIINHKEWMLNIIKTDCTCCILISVEMMLFIDNEERINDKAENMQIIDYLERILITNCFYFERIRNIENWEINEHSNRYC